MLAAPEALPKVGSPAHAGIDPACWRRRPAYRRFPRTRGDRPIRLPFGSNKNAVPPHKWVGGHTFEYEFELDMPVNSHYKAQPAIKSQPRKRGKHEASSESASVSSAANSGKAAKAKKPKRARLTPEELRERRRQRAAAERERRNSLGLCGDCANTAIAGQTRCPDCAEKHRRK